MVKKLVLLSLLLLAFVFVPPSHAQQAAQNEVDRYVCLNAVWCGDPGSGCSISGPGGAHTVKLTTRADSRALPNKDTYLLECLQTKTDRVCTTGNAEVDNQLFKKNTGALLKDQFQYTFQGLYQSDGKTVVSQKPAIKSSNIGAIGPYEWVSSTVQSQGRKFYALNRYKPEDVSAGTDGGQQQGTFSFENVEKKCIAIHWDPFGRIFDSQTLEPIPGATVTLLNGDTGAFYQIENGYLENPQTTLEHGGFSFVVPNGNYKLSVSLPDYQMTTPFSTKLNPSYSKILTGRARSGGTDTGRSGVTTSRGACAGLRITMPSACA